MESNYNSDNFERLLRESSDQYRMYPSESVWKNVYRALHTRRKWFGIGFLLLMLSAGFVTTIMLSNPVDTSKQVASSIIKQSATSPGAETKPEINKDEISLSPLYNNSFTVNTKGNFLAPVDPLPDNISTTDLIFTEQSSVETITDNSTTDIVKTDNTSKEGQQSAAFADASGPTTFEPINISISDEATDQNLYFTATKPESRKLTTSTSLNKPAGFYPYSIESVINSYVKRHKKLSFQFYFTPTISYRKLSENKSYLRSVAYNPNNTVPLYYDVNKVVTHKPDMGLEAGIAARYAIGKKMKLRAGLQFNTSRYDIKAYRSATEVTTIALNTGNFIPDSVNTISNYRNFNGYKSDWLHNLYFQVAAPIGLELQLAGDNRIKFGVAGTIQPTYILSDRVYLISTNYKNYAEVPSLIRRWNVNTSFEAFVGYSTGRMNWQVGPQVRYQLQSSFVKEYPVKENLFDFGLKIGVSANR